MTTKEFTDALKLRGFTIRYTASGTMAGIHDRMGLLHAMIELLDTEHARVSIRKEHMRSPFEMVAEIFLQIKHLEPITEWPSSFSHLEGRSELTMFCTADDPLFRQPALVLLNPIPIENRPAK